MAGEAIKQHVKWIRFLPRSRSGSRPAISDKANGRSWDANFVPTQTPPQMAVFQPIYDEYWPRLQPAGVVTNISMVAS
jgi:hypothetical protein